MTNKQVDQKSTLEASQNPEALNEQKFMRVPAAQFWFHLAQACELKNLNYKTAANRKWLQPNRGIPDGTVGGRKVWKRDTVLKWVLLTDEELKRSER